MSYHDEVLNQLIINKLSQDRYNELSANNEISANQLYFVEYDGPVDADNNPIVNVGDPERDTDAANKQYVDSSINDLSSTVSSNYITTNTEQTITGKKLINNVSAANLSANNIAISAINILRSDNRSVLKEYHSGTSSIIEVPTGNGTDLIIEQNNDDKSIKLNVPHSDNNYNGIYLTTNGAGIYLDAKGGSINVNSNIDLKSNNGTNGKKIIGLANPDGPYQATNKQYVDNTISSVVSSSISSELYNELTYINKTNETNKGSPYYGFITALSAYTPEYTPQKISIAYIEVSSAPDEATSINDSYLSIFEVTTNTVEEAINNPTINNYVYVGSSENTQDVDGNPTLFTYNFTNIVLDKSKIYLFVFTTENQLSNYTNSDIFPNKIEGTRLSLITTTDSNISRLLNGNSGTNFYSFALIPCFKFIYDRAASIFISEFNNNASDITYVSGQVSGIPSTITSLSSTVSSNYATISSVTDLSNSLLSYALSSDVNSISSLLNADITYISSSLSSYTTLTISNNISSALNNDITYVSSHVSGIPSDILDVSNLLSGYSTNADITYVSSQVSGLPASISSKTVFGEDAYSTSRYGIAIGCESYTDDALGVAIGNSVSAKTNSISIGTESTANTRSIAIGPRAASTNKGLAIGFESKGLHHGVALGCESSAISGTVAIGYETTASHQIPIIIKGYYKYDNMDKPISSVTLSVTSAGILKVNNSEIHTVTGKTTDTITVIGEGATGEDNGVAFGVSANGEWYGTAIGNSASAVERGVAIGEDADGSYNGVAVGRDTHAQHGVAVGYKSEGSYGVSIGYYAKGLNSSTAIGDSSEALSGAVAIGYKSYANHANPIVIKGYANYDVNANIPTTPVELSITSAGILNINNNEVAFKSDIPDISNVDLSNYAAVSTVTDLSNTLSGYATTSDITSVSSQVSGILPTVNDLTSTTENINNTLSSFVSYSTSSTLEFTPIQGIQYGTISANADGISSYFSTGGNSGSLSKSFSLIGTDSPKLRFWSLYEESDFGEVLTSDLNETIYENGSITYNDNQLVFPEESGTFVVDSQLSAYSLSSDVTAYVDQQIGNINAILETI